MGRERKDGGGFIAIWRSLRKSPYWFKAERRPATRMDAWLDLLLMASYEDETMIDRGETLTIKRGDILTSTVALAERWGWSRDRVSRFCSSAAGRGEVRLKQDSRRTIITICNYDKWQNVLAADKAADQQQTRQQKNTSNNLNHQTTQQTLASLALASGRNGDGVPLQPEPDPGHRALPEWWTETVVADTLRACRNHALTIRAMDLPLLDKPEAGMRKLLLYRDPETVTEVFTNWIRTRRKTTSIRWRNFFDYYEEHEQAEIQRLATSQGGRL